MITVSEFLEKNNINTQENIIKIGKIEKGLTKDNFMNSAKEVYSLMFGEDPEPIIFTGHKFFHTKVVEKPFTRPDLMEKGLHPFRMIFARHAEKLRAPGIDQFDTEGVIMYENFLDETFHKQVKEEIETHFPLTENKQPHNDISTITQYKYLSQLVRESTIFELCAEAAHRAEDDTAAYQHFLHTTYVQRLENIPGNGDIQKVCHSDVFYPCVKYWYFPDAVEEDQGPFLFAKNSVELTHEILQFHYRESVLVVNNKWDPTRNKGHGEGSFRAIGNDLQEMNLKLEPITCKPNTLVIANTSGFHCRGDAKQRHVRNALHGAIRVETPYDTYN